MKIKKDFILRKVGAVSVVVAVGEASYKFNGIMNLNESGEFLWKKLEKGADEAELVKALAEEYDIDEATAKRDTAAFLEKLEKADVIER